MSRAGALLPSCVLPILMGSSPVRMDGGGGIGVSIGVHALRGSVMLLGRGGMQGELHAPIPPFLGAWPPGMHCVTWM